MKILYILTICFVFPSVLAAQEKSRSTKDEDRLTKDALTGSWECTGDDKDIWTFDGKSGLTIEGRNGKERTQYRTAIHDLGELLIFVEDWIDDKLIIFVAQRTEKGAIILYRIKKSSELFKPRKRRNGLTLSFNRKKN